jgi:hypothetical protein
MGLLRLSDDSIIASYNSIRDEVEADKRVPFPVLGEAAKQRASQLAEELTRRKIRFDPIRWPI